MCNPEFVVALQPRWGCCHPPEYLTDLDFADDIALVFETVANALILLHSTETRNICSHSQLNHQLVEDEGVDHR